MQTAVNGQVEDDVSSILVATMYEIGAQVHASIVLAKSMAPHSPTDAEAVRVTLGTHTGCALPTQLRAGLPP
jgi:hypothetical protein